MRTEIIFGIKNVLPCDAKTMKEETDFKQNRIKEKIVVAVNGIRVETITRKLFAHDTHVSYCGKEYQLRGSGFDRWISVSGGIV